MRTEEQVGSKGQTVRLADYRPPNWLMDEVRLTLDLDPNETHVTARLAVRRNPDRAHEGTADFYLHGRMLTLVSASIDGEALNPDDISLSAEGLTIPAGRLPGDAFIWECETVVNPAANTALEGLYLSKGAFFTQCEAEGFRKITYYPDRPDVMSVFHVRIEADKAACPVLLSNGNPTASGDLEGGRHFAEWDDPFAKPSYLFALVAGDLVSIDDDYTTGSGRDVSLRVFVRKGDEGKCAYAMDSLKRSMRWDEQAYGREYDLDLFMIVATDDFNMGAMENKGLNIFNSKYVLASPETATDADYEGIESVIAHEYFHNWTGNRITCRDWFQLCLKEGLTVFRDQQFSEDQRSAAVVRIGEVKTLRARQFREDAGPLAHPVRPEQYIEINNFYTATVYEKGAEIIRMLRLLIGPEAYRRGCDLYFHRHDGEACTIEDWLACFEEVSGRDLSQFKRWYSQAGTPQVKVREKYDSKTRTYTLTFKQMTPPTPGQPAKNPLVIPIAFGLLSQDGAPISLEDEAENADPYTRVLELTAAEQSFVFGDVAEEPVPSLLRGFSAPVILEREISDQERAFLLAHDPDPFNRWEAGRAYALDVALAMAADIGRGNLKPPPKAFIEAMRATLTHPDLDPAFKALVFDLPSEDELAREMHVRDGAADPETIHAARDVMLGGLAEALSKELLDAYEAMEDRGPYSPDAESAGRRALKNRALAYLARLENAKAKALVAAQFHEADNMSDSLPALAALVHTNAPTAEAALSTFYQRWSGDSLVIDKWLAVQATAPLPITLVRVDALTRHEAFDWRNPNKFRALIGAFATANPSRFHAADGSGYAFFTDWLLKLDPVNPQTAARMAGAFETWRRYDAKRQRLIKAQLERIAGTEGLSKDTREIVGRVLGD